MGIFGGGGASVSNSTQRISSFQVNQSSYGSPIKLIFGTAMVNSVLCDFVDFTAIAHTTTTTSGGKGGGGGVTSSQTDYTYTVAGCLALGEGRLAGIGQVWSGSKTTDMYSLNLQFFDGSKSQAPWGYMLSKHPDHALSYSGTSYVAGVVDLGSSASLPNMNFEVYGLCQTQAPPQYYDLAVTTTTTASGHKIDEDSYALYNYSATVTLNGYSSLKSVTVSASNIYNENHTQTMNGNVCTITGSFFAYGYGGTTIQDKTVAITVVYIGSSTPVVPQPTNQKMQQFAYNKEIEISNFLANRYVEEYVFDPITAVGSWVTLDSRYYTITQSKDEYGNAKYGVYTYTFNFDDRSDGYDRVDPTYVRIYYTAIQATVDYTPTDANPRDIIYTLLTSTVYGENFPDVLIDEEALAVYSNYCKANSLLISPVYGEQTSCSDIINSLMECTNSAYVFSQGKVKIVPYWDGLTPIYAISDANFINQSEDTLSIERTSQADTYNIIPLEHTSRADQYNSNVVYATDEGDIELHGVRQAGTYSHPEIMNQSLAQAVAQLILQRQLYNRNKYKVKVGQEFILLEPMDAVTLESQLANLGLTSVRVVEIVESAEDYTLEITFEDNLSGVSSAPTYATQATDRAVTNFNVNPGDANSPIIFEAPAPLVTSATGYEVWMYASGQNEWWGGCNIWVSNDNQTYKLIGTIKQPARQGVLTDSLPIGTATDTTNTLKVDLSMSRRNLESVSAVSASDYLSLSWIKGADNGEFLAYRDATLTGQFEYNLNYLYRGVYGSSIQSHSSGAEYVRCDNDTVFKYAFQTKDIGTTFYIKLTSFNVFQTVEQALSDVEPTLFTIHGYNKQVLVESGTATITQDTPLTVTYSNTYNSPPYPQVTITDSWAGDNLVVQNMTTTSFEVYFTNDTPDPDPTNNPRPTTRTINYLVYGNS